MALFAIGNIMLKYKRPALPRLCVASWPHVLLALALVLTAIISTLIKNLTILTVRLPENACSLVRLSDLVSFRRCLRCTSR